jgi:hypothetical protein
MGHHSHANDQIELFNNGNTAVELLDPAMAQVDIAAWPDGEATVSYCRFPNGTGAFQVCIAQTFGAENM